MKKQFILSALIFSLSFSQATFTVDKSLETYRHTLNNLTTKELGDHLLKVFEKRDKNFSNQQANDLKNIKQQRKTIKKTRNIVDNTLVAGGIGAMSTTTYWFLTKQLDATLFTKAIMGGFGLISYLISNTLVNTHDNYKKNYKKKKDELLKEKANLLYKDLQAKTYPFQAGFTTRNASQINRSMITTLDTSTTFNDMPTIEWTLENSLDCLYNDEKIDATTKQNIEDQEALKEYLVHRKNDIGFYSIPQLTYKSIIASSLFGLAGCIAWAPEICSNFAKMTNFAVPYFNNIKMPNLSTGFTMPHFKASPLCAYFKKLFFTKS